MVTTDGPEFKRRIFPFIAYLLFLFGVWILWVLAIYPLLLTLGERTLLYALVNIGLRLLIWVVPVFLYLQYIDCVDPVDYLKLRQHWKRGLIVGVAFSLVNFILSGLVYGIPDFNWEHVTWNSVIGTSFLVGFIEEVPFRGFILQKLQERMDFWSANIISSTLFLLIHFPGWISLHLLSLRGVITVFVIGFLMALLLRYSRSLWSSIVAHSANDFISFLIFQR